jgi:hypothetical protein
MTVFRVIDAETMNPILQLRVTYRKVIFGMPFLFNNGATVNVNDFQLPLSSNLVWDFTIKDGDATLALERETKTTSRDWTKEND